tara:strand:+ start:133 stop:252 length:120 start_codon:yes stop_codon:yes gene_type:complete
MKGATGIVSIVGNHSLRGGLLMFIALGSIALLRLNAVRI